MSQPANGAFDARRDTDFRFLVERNADGVIVLDEDGTVLFANPAAEEAFGRSAADLIGTELGMPVVAGETTEIAILRPGGSQIDAEMRVVATIWEGRPALLVSLRDVSARKAFEERLRQAHKMESLGRLTAGIAHDFNNLLTVIMGNLGTIQREMAPMQPSPRLLRAVEHANEGANRAAALTQRLLAFARRQPLEPKSIDVNRLVAGMSDLLRRTLGEAIEIHIHLCEGVLQVLTDPSQLESAILNLAVNARDAMPDGGRLVIETEGCEIDHTRRDLAPGPYVEVRVRDNGVGMTRDVISHAFEPFFSTKEVGRGTGLGLSQVFGFVKQSGGDIGIESAPGAGTTVTLRLARLPSPEAAEQSEATPEIGEAQTASELLLVVDDEEGVRAFSAEALAEMGYRVLEAGDASSALRVLDERPDIQLLFTDVRLPGGMNGRQLAEEARRRRPGLKVLLTTGYAGDALVRGGRLESGLQLLSKPFTFAGLATKVRSVLEADGGPPRILVVEDEPMVRLTIVEALMDAGCQIEEAASSAEASAKFHSMGEVDAAVIDIGLPDGHGDGLVAEFRSIRPTIPILLATGYDNADARARFAKDARVRLLEKPFDGPGLRAALRELGVAVAP